MPPSAFVNFLQNHDQIGNRAFGERLATLTDATTVELLTATLLLAPHTPLLFMGEEWGERRPFCYFTDFAGDLATAVRDGRRAEFKKWPQFADPDNREKIPDPNAPATSASSAIDWAYAATREGQARLALVRRLLEIRARELMPRLAGIKGGTAVYEMTGRRAFTVDWVLGSGATLRLMANLGQEECTVGGADWGEMRPIYESRAGLCGEIVAGRLPASSVLFALRERPR